MTGSGTPADPFVIWDANDLQAMNLNPAACYELGQNIDASATAGWNGGLGFDPVGSWAAPFTGHFNGQNHTVTALTINRPLEDYIGLFSVTDGDLTIANVTLAAVNITGRDRVGALVGRVTKTLPSNPVITHCSSTGTITGDDYVGGLIGEETNGVGGVPTNARIENCWSSCVVTGDHTIGGLIGLLYYCTITGCHATGNVVSTGNRASGFIGQAYYNTISVCHATGNITGGQSYCGGLIAQCYFNTITESYATGNIIAPGDYCGGLVGQHVDSTCTQCHATGDIQGGVFSDTLGGFAGQISGSSTFTRCYATGNVVGGYILGGFGGRASSINDVFTDCYARGNVTGTGNSVGGFIGNHGTCINCYSTGRVTDPATYVGGFSGRPVESATACFWDLETSGQTTSGSGTGEGTSRMQDIAMFLAAGWNIEEHTSADFADGYPFLSWQVPGSSPVWFIFAPPGPPPPVPSVITLPATEVR